MMIRHYRELSAQIRQKSAEVGLRLQELRHYHAVGHPIKIACPYFMGTAKDDNGAYADIAVAVSEHGEKVIVRIPDVVFESEDIAMLERWVILENKVQADYLELMRQRELTEEERLKETELRLLEELEAKYRA